jgi:hypothetical protein
METVFVFLSGTWPVRCPVQRRQYFVVIQMERRITSVPRPPTHRPVFDLPEARSRVDDGTPRVPTPFGAPERDARVKVGVAAAKRLP